MTQTEALTQQIHALREEVRVLRAYCDTLKEAMLQMALSGKVVEERLGRLEEKCGPGGPYEYRKAD